MQDYKVLIIGAGPAGMMAAIRASQFCDRVCLLEKNRVLGKKLLISGKGRCNLTNVGDWDDFLNALGKNGEFLRDAFKALSNTALMGFFEKQGLRLKIERGGRVFPQDDKAASVLKILKINLQREDIEIVYNAQVQSIVRTNNHWNIKADGNQFFSAKRIILATGGASYSFTGSNGYGFKLAEKLGQTIVPIRPGLVPLEVREDWVRGLAGLSLRKVRICLRQGKDKWQSDIGEMLFTHFGVSGPLILEASSKVSDWFKKEEPIILSIDLKPGLATRQLEERLLRDLAKMGSKVYKNILKELLPSKLIAVFSALSKISPDKKANQITQQERAAISRLLKDFRLKITRPRPLEEAIITKGGVSTKEINPRTMESRLIPGLYFCGEIIDVDATTGGYNMQAAFSTGWLAGENAAQNLH